MILPTPARYFPIRGSRYDVAPALRPLSTSFGNGDADARVFQFDTDFAEFRANKLACRTEDLNKYVCFDAFDARVAHAVNRLIVERLTAEHPTLFTRTSHGNNSTLHCHLTGETLRLDGSESANIFDTLCCQFPEDIAVVRRNTERGDWLAALHICAPSHWSPGEKIGGSFTKTHKPVPGFEKNHTAAHSLVGIMVERGPFSRFTWGIEFDSRLNHHPDPPPNVAPETWNPPRRLDPNAKVPFVFRVERQVLWGLPAVDAALFAIRVYRYDGREIRADKEKCASLIAALRSMSPESRAYKGLSHGGLEDVVAFLES